MIRLANAVLCVFFLITNASAVEVSTHPKYSDNNSSNPVRLIMPDGQLKSHHVKIFLSRNISGKNDPRLCLSCIRTDTEEKSNSGFKPEYISRNHLWITDVDGISYQLNGTLMLFNLSQFRIPWYKAMERVTPSVSWKSKENDLFYSLAPKAVYLGNSTGSFFWTSLIIISLLLIITFIAARGEKNAIDLLCSSDKRISLSKTQIVLWTIAVGSLVTAYGLLRLEIPDIPESLVVLMGFSLLTGGVTYLQSGKGFNNSIEAGVNICPRLSDLIYDYTEINNGRVSIAKAQMLFWTVLTLVLFISKSILDGVLWEVPWQMVALMGISQAGYLSPKFMPANTGK